jgi:two-component system NtrC family sensor kinase
MRRAHQDSIRLLQGALVAATLVPLLLFGYAAALEYRTTYATAAREIERTADVTNEHALKVFEAVRRAIAEINSIIGTASDEAIRAREAELHARLKEIAEGSAQIKSLWIFGPDGRALANSIAYPVDATDFSDRDYFKAHVAQDIGTYVGAVLQPRPPYDGAAFFGVSRRRSSADGSFAGVIQASLLPDYFEGFYEKLAHEPGAYASLVRADGLLLARYPALNREVSLARAGPLYQSMLRQPSAGQVTLISAIDGVGRMVAYRKLAEFPVFVLGGLETQAVRNRWLRELRDQLTIGAPATLALIGITWLALRRTRRLYGEEARRQAAEEALKEAQRLEALGQLTGGVAHDFNNLLMIIGGGAQRMKSAGLDAKAARALEMIEAAVQKGESLTRQLLSFSSRQSLSPEIIDVGTCIESFADVLQQSLRSRTELKIVTPDPPAFAKIDKHEFEIALLNLVLNARDAMPDGGTITIRTLGAPATSKTGAPKTADEFICVQVTDTGAGIPEAIRAHIFEPYFTTKGVHRGTGLGLSQVYGFAKQSGGTITFETEIGRGTTFNLFLPAAPEPVPAAQPTDTTPAEARGFSHVLLVEDNPAVAEVAADYLKECGCAVLQAGNAEEALRLLTAHSNIDLVFSDIVMPGKSGLELARAVRERHAGIGVILASGYSDQATAALNEGFLLLNKPYSLAALQQALTDAAGQIKLGARRSA